MSGHVATLGRLGAGYVGYVRTSRNLLAFVDGYPPRLVGGAEVMLHCWLRDLQHRGYDVRVATTDEHAPDSAIHEGIPVVRVDARGPGSHWQWADLAITQLRETAEATRLGAEARVPVIYLVHAPRALEAHQVTSGPLAVFNAESVSRGSDFEGPRALLHPPVDPNTYRTSAGDRITLVNLGMWKGGNLFWRLARGLPERLFLAKTGGYSQQIIPAEIPPNVELVTSTVGRTPEEMRDHVYARTRILLVPSAMETWGRVAIEAASSGIPVIAHPTPGLRESLGDSGIFVDRDDTAGWIAAIRNLDDPAVHADYSHAVRERAEQLWRTTQRQLDTLAELVGDLVAGRRVDLRTTEGQVVSPP